MIFVVLSFIFVLIVVFLVNSLLLKVNLDWSVVVFELFNVVWFIFILGKNGIGCLKVMYSVVLVLLLKLKLVVLLLLVKLFCVLVCYIWVLIYMFVIVFVWDEIEINVYFNVVVIRFFFINYFWLRSFESLIKVVFVWEI